VKLIFCCNLPLVGVTELTLGVEQEEVPHVLSGLQVCPLGQLEQVHP